MSKSTIEIDIWFDDLCEERQQELLNSFGIIRKEEMNWNVIPIATVPVSQEESQ